MRRREFITFSAALWSLAATIWPITVLGRQGPWHIGWLDPSVTPTAAAPSQALTAFEQRLKELGYVEGRDFVIESRFADTYWDRLPGLASDLVGRGVDVIVTIGTATVMVAKKATTTIPIVMAGAGEPIELGLVPSLSHPGGNVTGLAHNPGPEFAGKSLDLLIAADPKISRVAILWDSSALHEDPSLEGQREAARALGLTLLIHDIADAHTESSFATLLATVKAEAPDAAFVYPNFIAAKHRKALLTFLTSNRLPSMFQDATFAEQGALFSYYADWIELRPRSAEYVDKIFKGATPSEPSCGTAATIRANSEPEDSEGVRPHHFAFDPGVCKQGYRVKSYGSIRRS